MWKQGTIKLAAAQDIFVGVTFAEIKIGEKTVGYRAGYRDQILENASLTALCGLLWQEVAK
jgi:hypothetical protein